MRAILALAMALMLQACGGEPKERPPTPLRLQTCLPPLPAPQPPPAPRTIGDIIAWTTRLVAALDRSNLALADCHRRLEELNALDQLPD